MSMHYAREERTPSVARSGEVLGKSRLGLKGGLSDVYPSFPNIDLVLFVELDNVQVPDAGSVDIDRVSLSAQLLGKR